LSKLERNIGFVTIIIAAILIIGSISLVNIALSKSSWFPFGHGPADQILVTVFYKPTMCPQFKGEYFFLFLHHN
jgi:hypothetical protein